MKKCTTTMMTREAFIDTLNFLFTPEDDVACRQLAGFAIAACGLWHEVGGDSATWGRYMQGLKQRIRLAEPLDCAALGQLSLKILEHLEAIELLTNSDSWIGP
ncbi:MAG: hypothetical protein JWO20_515 [Candidatus Angelobacter sp.]|nr:hypothetical protein [Candidatus Angelobacter sp.]